MALPTQANDKQLLADGRDVIWRNQSFLGSVDSTIVQAAGVWPGELHKALAHVF